MMKKIAIVLFVLGFLSIFSGLGVGFVSSLQEDRTATLARMEDVKLEYKNFSDSVDVFNDIRNSLYLSVFEEVYYDTMASTDASVKESFSNYEASVNGVMKTVDNLSSLCDSIYFPDNNVNIKCNGFGSVYEQIVNAFVSDVELYNNNILQYNDYQKENGATLSLDGYVTEKKYIDYNKDKKYEGKEE